MSKPDFLKRIGTEWSPDYSVSSGSLLLDRSPALSNYGGIPAGTMVQIASKKEGSFKTSLALAGAKAMQEQGKKIAFIDAEAGLTGLDWIKANGLSTDKDLWTYAQPEDGEEAFAMAEFFIKDKEHYGIIIDSIDSCQPSSIMNSEFGDQCLTPETEILTEEGFVRLDELSKDQKVAQYNEDESIEFVKPLEYFKLKYNKDIYHYKGSHGIDLKVTENHDMVYLAGRNKKLKKEKAKDQKVFSRRLLIKAGNKLSGESKLTPEDKLWIAFQADGNRSKKSRHKNKIYFTFSVERKIKQFKELMEQGGFEYERISDSGNQKRYSVHYPKPISKNLKDWFTLKEINHIKAKEIINYCILWDGCTIKTKRYGNTNESAIDFYQEVATIGGIRSLKSVAYEDGYREGWKKMFRLSFQEKNTYNCNGVSLTKEKYDGDVYCLTVPSGMIVVRRNGRPLVTGNSIGQHAKLVTSAVRKFKTQVRTNQKVMWLVNQMRVNITQMGARGFKSTGGDAIDFYCKLNLVMDKDKSDNQLKDTDYIPLTIGVKRSKIGTSYIDIPTYAIQGKGIDQEAELVHLATERGIIYKAGSWYKHDKVDKETGEIEEIAIGQGIEKARAWCIENKEEILNG